MHTERFSFPETEREILKYWEEIDAFQTSLKLAKGRPECVCGWGRESVCEG